MGNVERTFDRIPHQDPRNRLFNIAAVLPTRPPRSYTWPCYWWLDQGTDGACVGHAWAHEAAAMPVVVPEASEAAHHIYREAQKVDYWPGEDYEGTSVLAGAKIMQRAGWLEEYRWAFSLNDVVTAVSRTGPAVLGCNWYEGMMETDSKGFIRPTGDMVGGHAVLLVGANVPGEYVTIHNSWGKTWGTKGQAKISWADLARLLKENGEVCVPVRRSATTKVAIPATADIGGTVMATAKKDETAQAQGNPTEGTDSTASQTAGKKTTSAKSASEAEVEGFRGGPVSADNPVKKAVIFDSQAN